MPVQEFMARGVARHAGLLRSIEPSEAAEL